MTPFRTAAKPFVIVILFMLLIACESRITVNEKDEIFHGGPVNDGLGAIFFGLYKDNKYQFCDGTFMDPGCYTGLYGLSGDTITLYKLKKHDHIPTNRFLIRRYRNMDSSYWQMKYPHDKDDWQMKRVRDLSNGSTGDVVPLNQKGEMVFDSDNYFLIRFDELK